MRKDFYAVYDEYFHEAQTLVPVKQPETPVESFRPSDQEVQPVQNIVVDHEIEVVPDEPMEDSEDADGADSQLADE